MFLYVSVNLFTGGLSHCMLGYTPSGTRGRHPLDQRQTHPPGTRHSQPAQCMLGDTGNKRLVRTLLECNLVSSLNSLKNSDVMYFAHLVNEAIVDFFRYVKYEAHRY